MKSKLLLPYDPGYHSYTFIQRNENVYPQMNSIKYVLEALVIIAKS